MGGVRCSFAESLYSFAESLIGSIGTSNRFAAFLKYTCLLNP